MKNKRITPAFVALAVLMLIGVTLIGCSSEELAHILGGGSIAFPTTPKFLIAVDSCSGLDNVNVFPITTGTGVLGPVVAGSPFSLGVTDAMALAMHPNGHWVYVPDQNDGTIHQWDVNTTSGVPTEIAAKIANESGSFFEPSGGGCGDSPMRAITVTPDGKHLYAANHDTMISEYSIGSNGALTHMGDVAVTGASHTGAITANNSFAWVTDTTGANSGGPWHVMTMKIGADGSLTNVSTATLTSVFSWLWSIAVSPDGKFVQVGDEGGNAQVYSFTVGTDGSLTQQGPQIVLKASSDARFIAYSPDSKFIYVTDDNGIVHVMTQNLDGTFTELGASPYTGDDGQIEVDRTGQFVYLGGCDNCNGVYGYTRDATTGALTAMPGSPFATQHDEAVAIGIIRVAP